MAGDWIKMRTDLLTSPKVVRMASALKADRFRIAGGLLSVWSLFDSHSTDGNLVGYSLETLDDLAAWPGFALAMEQVGWLEQIDGSLVLPRFEDHNGASAKRRAQDKDRKSNVRKMSASEADKMRTREEKIERRDKELPPSCPPAEKPAKAPTKKTKIPDPFNLTGEMRQWAIQNAPAVDLLSETAKFVDYWRAEAKTKADWVATWRNWMRRAQDQLNRQWTPRGNGQGRNPQQEAHDHNMAVLRQIEEQERLRMASEAGGQFLEPGGDLLTLDGEVLHAGS